MGEPSRRPEIELNDTDRLEALENQVRQLVSRLAAWVEAQLVQAVDDRRGDLRALRAELQAVLNEQVATARAESASMLTVATRRLSVNQEQLGERLEDVAGRATEAVASVAALTLSTTTDAHRIESLEHQLGQRLNRLADSVQAQLTDSADRRRAQMGALRDELEAALSERLHVVARQADQASERVASLGASAEAEAARMVTVEERLRSAMSRLGEALEAKLEESTAARVADLDAVRTQLQAATDERIEQSGAANASMLASVVERLEGVAGQASQSAEAMAALTVSSEAGTARIEAFERRVRSAIARLTEAVDAGLSAATRGREADVGAVRAELHAALDDRVRQLTDRTEQAAQAEAVRTEAFEERVRGAIARLTETVEARLDEATTGRGADLEALRSDVHAAVDGAGHSALETFRAELQAALDERLRDQSMSAEAEAARIEALEGRVRSALAGLAESVDSKLAESASGRDGAFETLRAELQAALDERLSEFGSQAALASAEGLAAVSASVEAETARTAALEERVRAAVVRLTESVDSRLAEAMAGRQDEAEGLRSELRAAIDEGRDTALESFRTELQGVLDERLRSIATQAAHAADGLAALSSSLEVETARTAAFEERVRAALVGLTESVDSKLAESATGRDTALESFRTELQAALDEQLQEISAQAARANEGVVALTASAEAEAGRTEAFEERVRAAVVRLTESVDARLADAVTGRQEEVEGLRAELQAAVDERLREVASQAALAAEGLAAVSSSVEAESARTAAFEERVRAAVIRLTELMDTRLAEAVTGRHEEVEGLRSEWRTAIDAGRDTVMESLRTELQTVIDGRLQEIAAQAARAAEGVVALTASSEAEAGRTEAFEDRVRAAVVRLTESLDSRLAEAATGREGEVAGLRADFQDAIAASRETTLEAFRTELQGVMEERLQEVAAEATRATGGLAALTASAEAETARSLAFEERVRSVVSRLTESVEAIATTSATGKGEVEAVKAEMRAALDERLAALQASEDAHTGRVDHLEERMRSAVAELQARLDDRVTAASRQATDGLAALTQSLEAEATRLEAFEHRVRTAMGRLTASVETQLAESARGRDTELEALRTQVEAALVGQLADRVGELVDARLADVVERRRAEFQTLQAELQEALTQQLNEARSQIAAAVAGANKRFVRAHEQLSERMQAVAQQSAGSAEKVDAVAEAASAGGPRLEALELHASRTDERIAQLVEAKVTQLAGDVRVEMAALRSGVEEALATQTGEVRAQLAASVAERVRQFEERLAHTEAQMADSAERSAAEIAAFSGKLAEVRSEVAAAAAAETRTSSRAQDQLRIVLEDMAGRVDELASAASAERGALAPLRSDVRFLQTEVSELAEAVAEVRSRRRTTTPPDPAPPAVRRAGTPARKAPAAARPAARKATATKAPPGVKRTSRPPKNGQ